MLVFESLTPEALLKEIADYVLQEADSRERQNRHAQPQRDKIANNAAANALKLVAGNLQDAGIMPARSILRDAPVTTPAELMEKALGVIVLTQHIREYLELYDPQALAQATDALTAHDPNFPAKLAGAREHNAPEAAYGQMNRRMDELMGRKPHGIDGMVPVCGHSGERCSECMKCFDCCECPDPEADTSTTPTEADKESLARMERELERVRLGMPQRLIHVHGNTYFQKMGHLLTADLIEDEHGRWIAAVFQGELGVSNQNHVAARIAQLWNKNPETAEETKARTEADAAEDAALDGLLTDIIDKHQQRLEYLRGELRAERISYGELAELQSLAEHIAPDDVELREAAGLPEQTPANDLTQAIQFWSDIGREFGAQSVWSMYEEAGREPDGIGIYGTGLTLTYEPWGHDKVSTPLPDNPTWRQLYIAADKLIREGGDKSHIYIEFFRPSTTTPCTYELTTGS